MIKKLLIGAIFMYSTNFLWAQDSTSVEKKESKLELSVNLKTNQMWKGSVTTDKPVVTSQVTYGLTKNNNFKIGVWGGTGLSNNTNGTQYVEIDYFLQYSVKGFTVELWDFFNSTNINPQEASRNIFNYSRGRTAHLFDLGLTYELPKSIPFIIEADILVYGGANTGEVLYDSDGKYKKNRYSTFINLNYPVQLSGEYTFKPYIGGAFAFNPGDPDKGETTHIFGNGKNKFDIVNVGFNVSKDFTLFKKKFPVTFMTFWNPSNEYARVQVAVKLI